MSSVAGWRLQMSWDEPVTSNGKTTVHTFAGGAVIVGGLEKWARAKAVEMLDELLATRNGVTSGEVALVPGFTDERGGFVRGAGELVRITQGGPIPGPHGIEELQEAIKRGAEQ